MPRRRSGGYYPTDNAYTMSDYDPYYQYDPYYEQERQLARQTQRSYEMGRRNGSLYGYQQGFRQGSQYGRARDAGTVRLHGIEEGYKLRMEHEKREQDRYEQGLKEGQARVEADKKRIDEAVEAELAKRRRILGETYSGLQGFHDAQSRAQPGNPNYTNKSGGVLDDPNFGVSPAGRVPSNRPQTLTTGPPPASTPATGLPARQPSQATQKPPNVHFAPGTEDNPYNPPMRKPQAGAQMRPAGVTLHRGDTMPQADDVMSHKGGPPPIKKSGMNNSQAINPRIQPSGPQLGGQQGENPHKAGSIRPQPGRQPGGKLQAGGGLGDSQKYDDDEDDDGLEGY